MTNISMIVAHDQQRIIGRENNLPWRLSADLKYFKQKTVGKPLLMGRKTFDSIGQPLPGRRMMILSRNPELHINGCETFQTPEQVIEACQDADEIMVAGGAEIYRIFLPHAQRLYITEVHTVVEGDASFPEYSAADWCEASRESHRNDEKNEYDYDFVVYDRLPSLAIK